jgi:RNA polymerase sigma factor (sigma-70 family)
LIYGVARKAGLSDAEAHDIIQETVISVARKIEGFVYDPKVCSFKAWMLRLTRWRIINQLKRRQREGLSHQSIQSDDRALIIEQIPDPHGLQLEASWDEEWEKNLFTAALERVKRRVDPEQFQIFDLYCLEKWPAQKVARTLGINSGRVYLARHRIANLIRHEIKTIEKRDY